MSESKNTAERQISVLTRRERFVEVEHAQNIGQTLRRLMTYFLHQKILILIIFMVVILGTICGIYAPSLQSQAVDIIAGTLDQNLYNTVLFMIIVYLIYSVSQLVQGMLSAKLSQYIVNQMRKELFDKIIDLPIQYLDTHSHGDVMSRMTNDIDNISTTVSQSLPSLFSGVLTIIGTICIMIWYCWQLALLSCVTIFLTVLATKFLSKKVRKFSRHKQELLGTLNGTVEEMISGYRTVVAYNHQNLTTDDFCKTSDSLTKAGIKTDIFSGVMGPIMNCIGNIGFVIIAAFGGFFAIKGMISVGVISAFIVYAKQLSRPINEIAQIYGQLQTAIAGAERVFFVLDEKDEDQTGEQFKESSTTNIVFENVQFSYEKGHPILHNFSLTIPSGKKVALVGATGSGKTTVVNLLMRFYDIEKGHILINEQDIQNISRKSLRQNIAIVLQDTVLFTDTIKNNLLYGNEKVTNEDLVSTVKMSHCQDLIQRLPKGYETLLIGSGQNLSQGERQLLAIARALVADPKIFILDEATSHVDTRTEKAIQDAMQQAMRDRTSIIIAHRLSTIRDADIIIVMDQGQIVEQGNHEQLLSQKGKYYELYMTQFAGFVI